MQSPVVTIPEIPQQYWPLIDWLFTGLIVLVVLWIASTAFILLRRSASGLTPVQAAQINKNARPDFLDGDQKKRKEALERGAAYDRELEKAEAEEREIERKKSKEPLNATARLMRLLSLIMAFFSLATLIGSVIFQVTYINGLLEQASAGDQIMMLVQRHPIGVSIAVIVILYHVVTFVTDKKWKPGESA